MGSEVKGLAKPSLFYHDLVSNLDRAVGRGHRQTDVIVMDFAKAFDKVPHKRLLYKLDFYGIRGSTHKWIDCAEDCCPVDLQAMEEHQ